MTFDHWFRETGHLIPLSWEGREKQDEELAKAAWTAALQNDHLANQLEDANREVDSLNVRLASASIHIENARAAIED